MDEERELSVPEGLVKVVLGAAAAFLAKKLVENSVETSFKRYRKPEND